MREDLIDLLLHYHLHIAASSLAAPTLAALRQGRACVYQDMTTAWSQDVKGPRCQGVKEARCQEMIATTGQEHRGFLDGRFAGAYGNIY